MLSETQPPRPEQCNDCVHSVKSGGIVLPSRYRCAAAGTEAGIYDEHGVETPGRLSRLEELVGLLLESAARDGKCPARRVRDVSEMPDSYLSQDARG